MSWIRILVIIGSMIVMTLFVGQPLLDAWGQVSDVSDDEIRSFYQSAIGVDAGFLVAITFISVEIFSRYPKKSPLTVFFLVIGIIIQLAAILDSGFAILGVFLSRGNVFVHLGFWIFATLAMIFGITEFLETERSTHHPHEQKSGS